MEDHSSEQATYLWVAETVLRKHRRPLSARQLVTFGIEDGLFADTSLSRTPQKSMQARLSIDILRQGKSSRFLRTGPGRFYLRESIGEKSASEGNGETEIIEYTAPRRAPSDPSEQVLVIPKSAYVDALSFQGISLDYEGILNSLLSTKEMTYIPRTEAETNSEFKQFITYTIIQQKDRILSFRRGQYNRAASFLRGARCVGFGGHVTEDDLNILTYEDSGIKANAAREISEEIRLANGDPPKINPDEIELLGFLNDNSSDVGVRHVAAVLRYWAPDTVDWQKPQRGEAGISQLRWMRTIGAEIDLLEFEYWSQLVLRNFYPTFITGRPSLRIVKQRAFSEPHLLCITGSIGSGKSVTTQHLCSVAGYHQINTGRVVARLIGLPPVPQTPRSVFQARAYELISGPDGPAKLADAILDEVERSNQPRIIIDGLRQLETLEKLRERSKRAVAMIFVHTPPDVAYQLYVLREAKAASLSLDDFMSIYNAPVESEVKLFIEEADAIIYNWQGIEAYERVIQRLIKELRLD